MDNSKAAAREKHDKGPRDSTRSTHNHNWSEARRRGSYCSRAWCCLTLTYFRWSRKMTTTFWISSKTATLAILVIVFTPPRDSVDSQNKINLRRVVVGFTTRTTCPSSSRATWSLSEKVSRHTLGAVRVMLRNSCDIMARKRTAVPRLKPD